MDIIIIYCIYIIYYLHKLTKFIIYWNIVIIIKLFLYITKLKWLYKKKDNERNE